MSAHNSKFGTALVTGASSGIGRAFAQRLAADGFDLILVARRAERLEELSRELRELGVAAEALVADLASDEGLKLVEQRVCGDPQISMLVNNAGFAHFGAHLDETADFAEGGLRVMVLATVRLTRAVLPNFVKAGRGTVINVSSRAAFGANARLSTYSAAKAYVNRYTLGIAEEFESQGLRFLAVCPGNVETELFERAGIDPASMRGCMQPENVVEASMAALENGERVCVPGERRRDRMIRSLLPSGLAKKLANYLNRIAGS
ncbi:MAG: short-subunit dehydrogenase [Planctomycetota bacterium]|jgi:short-subunit dehydrogenase